MSITADAVETAPAQTIEAFTFGEPLPVLDRRELLDILQCLEMRLKTLELCTSCLKKVKAKCHSQ